MDLRTTSEDVLQSECVQEKKEQADNVEDERENDEKTASVQRNLFHINWKSRTCNPQSTHHYAKKVNPQKPFSSYFPFEDQQKKIEAKSKLKKMDPITPLFTLSLASLHSGLVME